VHNWNTFGARTSHEQTRTHKTHHGLDLGEATTFPFIVYFVHGHGANIQMSLCPRTPKWESWVPKFPKLGLLRFWGPITLSIDLWLRWHMKKSCSPCQELSKVCRMPPTRKEIGAISWLLVVGSQIANLTFGPSFGHNLCFKNSNGSCVLILSIHVWRAFQWYKEGFNLMSFDPCDCSLKIKESIGTPTPKVGAHLGMWGFIPSHSPTLPGAWDVTHELLFLARTFASPCLRHKPKARVVIHKFSKNI
jgi:hypothetical protein